MERVPELLANCQRRVRGKRMAADMVTAQPTWAAPELDCALVPVDGRLREAHLLMESLYLTDLRAAIEKALGRTW
jgi:hypothetical protein